MANKKKAKPFRKYIYPFLITIVVISIGICVIAFNKVNFSSKPASGTYNMSENNIEAIEVQTAPKLSYKKEVLLSGFQCGVPKGVVVYTDEKTGSVMYISSSTLPKSKELMEYLGGNEYNAFESIIEFEYPFTCANYYSEFIKSIAIDSYKGTDLVRAHISYQGQDYGGSIVASVFAKKGNDVIYLRRLIGRDLYEKYADECFTSNVVSNEDSEICYTDRILSDPILEEIAAEYTQELVSIFALKE